jgi:hypothetical protein
MLSGEKIEFPKVNLAMQKFSPIDIPDDFLNITTYD